MLWLVNLGFGGGAASTLMTGGETGYAYGTSSASTTSLVTAPASAASTLVSTVPAAEPSLATGVADAELTRTTGPATGSGNEYIYGA